MKNELNIVGIQSGIVWEKPEVNLEYFDQQISMLPSTVDLVILPEMFTTGFTMNAMKLAELENGETLIWMKNQALKMNCAITGSLIISKNNFFYNRLFFVFPSHSIDQESVTLFCSITIADLHEVALSFSTLDPKISLKNL